MKPAELGAVALAGFAVWGIASVYGTFAPSLADIRGSDCEDRHRQQMLDCNVMVGGLAVAAGAMASSIAKSWVPAVVVIATFLWLSGYYRLVLHGPVI